MGAARSRHWIASISFLSATAFGTLFGGLGGALIATAGFVLALRHGPRLVAATAIACLLAAVVATVTEAGFSVQWDEFGHTRLVAGSLARAAGILAWVAVIAFIDCERRESDRA